MSDTRLTWLLAGLVALLLLRWVDPWPVVPKDAASGVVQAIVRAPAGSTSASSPEGSLPDANPANPVSDRLATSSPVRDLFITRTAVNAEAQQAQLLAAQKAQRKQPPPPQPPPPVFVEPPEPQPPLKVVGTWGGDDTPAVFLSTPNGTVMAQEANIVLGHYKVQRIEPRQISLQNTQTQKVWTLPIPEAPSATSAWPSRSSP